MCGPKTRDASYARGRDPCSFVPSVTFGSETDIQTSESRPLNFIERTGLGIVQAFEELLECLREQVSPDCPGVTRAGHGLGVANDEHIGLPRPRR